MEQDRVAFGIQVACREMGVWRRVYVRELGGWGGGCIVLAIMHGCSLTTIDPRIPTISGRSTRGFTDEAGIACTKREAP